MTYETARAIAADVQAQTRSAVAVMQRAHATAQTLNPKLNALSCFNPNMLAEAREVDDKVARGVTLPLAGVPIVIKDNIWVKDLLITNGSCLFETFIPRENAIAVSRLRTAGAVILGIGTCSEFACKGVTNTPLHGITRHPSNPNLTPGGSSGGPAVAVASGMVPVAIGTDAGGSSRRPPAHVGVVGFKPSQDAVPYGPGFCEPVWGISTICPITHDVADTALVFAVLSGMPLDATPPNSCVAYACDMGLGVAVDQDVADVCDAAIAVLADIAHITRTGPDWGIDARPASVMALQFSGLAALYGAHWKTSPNLFDPDIGVQIETGLGLTGVEVAQAHQASQGMRDVLRTFMCGYDFLISPTTPCVAWPATRLGPATIGGQPASARDHTAFTPQANHAGLPAINIPCGFTPQNLPVGLQIIGTAGSDILLLAFAQDCETTLRTVGLTRIDAKVTI
jgi:aspartyl-tRNA(Asn)/glutamyl-tRNA(Gln) amidotransferase subunit A